MRLEKGLEFGERKGKERYSRASNTEGAKKKVRGQDRPRVHACLSIYEHNSGGLVEIESNYVSDRAASALGFLQLGLAWIIDIESDCLCLKPVFSTDATDLLVPSTRREHPRKLRYSGSRFPN